MITRAKLVAEANETNARERLGVKLAAGCIFGYFSLFRRRELLQRRGPCLRGSAFSKKRFAHLFRIGFIAFDCCVLVALSNFYRAVPTARENFSRGRTLLGIQR